MKPSLEFLPLPGPSVIPEEKFLLDHSGFLYRGAIDLQDKAGGLRIAFDYKTSSNPRKYGLNESTLGIDMAANIYAAAVMMKHRVDEVHLRWVYTCTRGKPDPYPVDKRLTKSQVDANFVSINRLAAEVTHEGLRATKAIDLRPNYSACGSFGGCPFVDICPQASTEDAIRAAFALGSRYQPKDPMSDLANAMNSGQLPAPPPNNVNRQAPPTAAQQPAQQPAQTQPPLQVQGQPGMNPQAAMAAYDQQQAPMQQQAPTQQAPMQMAPQQQMPMQVAPQQQQPMQPQQQQMPVQQPMQTQQFQQPMQPQQLPQQPMQQQVPQQQVVQQPVQAPAQQPQAGELGRPVIPPEAPNDPNLEVRISQAIGQIATKGKQKKTDENEIVERSKAGDDPMDVLKEQQDREAKKKIAKSAKKKLHPNEVWLQLACATQDLTKTDELFAAYNERFPPK